jgi:hypothetical protein
MKLRGVTGLIGVASAAVAVAAAVVLAMPASAARPTLSPGLFDQVSSGIAQIKTFGCEGRPIALGSGFLVGDSVVMTARHVLKGACRVSVRVDGETFRGVRWVSWFATGSTPEAADVSTIKLDRPAQGAYVLRIRASSPPLGTNLAAVGYPLGNRLSLNQGKLVRRGRVAGVPLIAVKMLGAEGGSGSAFLDDQGRVVGMFQRELIGFIGQETSDVLVGLDLVRWWGPRARLDLCRAYPHGGIAGCPTTHPTPPPPPPPTPPPPPPTPAPVTFPDSVGEDPQAPDITSVNVSATNSGLMTFKINISNRPTLTSDMAIVMWIDSDANPSTGDPQALGTEYLIILVPGSIGMLQWNGSSYVTAPSETSLTYAYDATGATIRVSTADLGGTRAINFGVRAWSGIVNDANGNPDFSNAHQDDAPDQGHGFYSYNLG